jgi:hypothetical protein
MTSVTRHPCVFLKRQGRGLRLSGPTQSRFILSQRLGYGLPHEIYERLDLGVEVLARRIERIGGDLLQPILGQHTNQRAAMERGQHRRHRQRPYPHAFA